MAQSYLESMQGNREIILYSARQDTYLLASSILFEITLILQAAIALCEQSANHKHVEAFTELAKCFQQPLNDASRALEWTNSAIDLLEDETEIINLYPILDSFQRQQALNELRHRQNRLHRKMDLAT